MPETGRKIDKSRVE